MCHFLLLITAFCLVPAVLQKKYDGYKVFEVQTDSKQAKDVYNFYGELDFLTPLRKNGGVTKIMVAPKLQEKFTEYLDSHDIKHYTVVENVQRAIQKERVQRLTLRTTKSPISFTYYERHDRINDYLQYLASNYENIVSLERIGHSYEDREMIVIKISSSKENQQKPVILIDAGIHAREWIAPATALYIINQLVEVPSNRVLIRNVDWHILPVLNPDGYEYTHTTDRLWRKTRSPGKICYGADANRNFDYHWGEVGASVSECSDIYRGPYAFSETELRHLRDFAKANADRIKLYLTLHSYGGYILYPWGYTDALPDDSDELHSLGESVATAMKNYSGNTFIVGSSTNVLYASAGGADDWMKGVNGVNLSYTIELPADDDSGFEFPPENILSSVQETFVGIRTFHSYIEKKFVLRKLNQNK